MYFNDVSFVPSEMYMGKTDGQTTRDKKARLTVLKAPAGTSFAKVVNGWHWSPSDELEHCTVDYYSTNMKQFRDHIHRPDIPNNMVNI